MTDQDWKKPGRNTRSSGTPSTETATLTRADIAKSVYNAVPNQSRQMAENITDAVLDMISDAIARGENVKLSGFGVFRIHEKKERAARNPATGAPAIVSARKVVLFNASPLLKNAMNQDNQPRKGKLRARNKSSK